MVRSDGFQLLMRSWNHDYQDAALCQSFSALSRIKKSGEPPASATEKWWKPGLVIDLEKKQLSEIIPSPLLRHNWASTSANQVHLPPFKDISLLKSLLCELQGSCLILSTSWDPKRREAVHQQPRPPVQGFDIWSQKCKRSSLPNAFPNQDFAHSQSQFHTDMHPGLFEDHAILETRTEPGIILLGIRCQKNIEQQRLSVSINKW